MAAGTGGRARQARLVPESSLPPSRLPPPWPGRDVVLDGVRVHVRHTPGRSPAAEPAVYVHGLGGSGQNWTDLADLLADRLDGQALDLPGFGRSEPAHGYTPSAFADRVIRWIEHADRGPVHLLGNSLGGTVSVHVASARPDLVRTLTLISPAMPFLDPRRSVQARVLPLLWLPRAERLAARRFATMEPTELATMIIRSCFADPDRLPARRRAEALEEVALRATVPWYAAAYVRSMRGLVGAFVRAYLPGERSLWRLAARITAPTLVMCGRRDRLVDVRVASQVAAAIPDSRLLEIEDVGHLPQMEVPRLVARAVHALLDEAGPARYR